MRTNDVVIQRDADTGLLVAYVPGWPGAHTQGTDVDEVQGNLREVLEMLLEDGESRLGSGAFMVPDLVPATEDIRALCVHLAPDLHDVAALLKSSFA